MCVLVIQLCLTLCNPMDDTHEAPLSVHGILQARIQRGIAIPFSRGSSRPRDGTLVSCIAGRRFTVWATGEGALKGRLYLGDRLFQMAVQYTECSCVMNLFDSYNGSRQTKPDTDGADVKKKKSIS